MRLSASLIARLPRWRTLGLLLFLGYMVACLLSGPRWALPTSVALVVLVLVICALPYKGRKITPEQWADELERHLLANEGAYDWDDATSVKLADERLESLRGELIPHFDRLDTPEKREQLREIIKALRRGEVPLR